MSLSFLTNSYNDFYLDDAGNIAMGSDILATQQVCLNAAKSIRGEVVLNTLLGLPNFQTIWIGNPNLNQFEAALRNELSQIAGVLSIDSIDTLISGDAVVYRVVILTVYGRVVINSGL